MCMTILTSLWFSTSFKKYDFNKVCMVFNKSLGSITEHSGKNENLTELMKAECVFPVPYTSPSKMPMVIFLLF